MDFVFGDSRDIFECLPVASLRKRRERSAVQCWAVPAQAVLVQVQRGKVLRGRALLQKGRH